MNSDFLRGTLSVAKTTAFFICWLNLSVSQRSRWDSAENNTVKKYAVTFMNATVLAKRRGNQTQQKIYIVPNA